VELHPTGRRRDPRQQHRSVLWLSSGGTAPASDPPLEPPVPGRGRWPHRPGIRCPERLVPVNIRQERAAATRDHPVGTGLGGPRAHQRGHQPGTGPGPAAGRGGAQPGRDRTVGHSVPTLVSRPGRSAQLSCLAYGGSPASPSVGGPVCSDGNLYKVSMFSCCASASTESCCSCAFSAVCFASSDARPPSCRTPMTSMRTWLAEKIAMPSTRRSACPGGERAAPTFAASNGSVGCTVSLLRSSITHLWNFITAPCRGRFRTSSVASPKRLPLLKQRA
jgi:hypothetical protein